MLLAFCEQPCAFLAHVIIFHSHFSSFQLPHPHGASLPNLTPRPSTTISLLLRRSSLMLSAMPSGMPRSWRNSRFKKNWMQRRSGWIRWWRWNGRNPFKGRRIFSRRGERKESGKEVVWASFFLPFSDSLGPGRLSRREEMRNGHCHHLLLSQNLYKVIMEL